MKKIMVLLIAALLVALGLTGVLWPPALIDLAKWTLTSKGLYAAAAIRVVFGLVLLFAARATATPKIVRVIGGILAVGGIATAVLTTETAQRLSNWWLENGEDRIRIAACIPLAVGIFLGAVTVFRKP